MKKIYIVIQNINFNKIKLKMEMLNYFNKASEKLTNYFSFFEDKVQPKKKDIIESLILVTPNIFIWIDDKNYSDEEFISLIFSNFKDNYMIYNILPRKINTKYIDKIVDFKLPNNPSYTLEFLISFCISAENWLSANKKNILIIHDDVTINEGKIFYLLSALITYNYNKQKEFSEPVSVFASITNAFKSKKFIISENNNKNNIRYLNYFSSILKSPLLSLNKIFLNNILISGAPAIDNDDNNNNLHFVVINQNSFYTPVIRIKSNDKYIYSSYDPKNENQQKIFYSNDSVIKFEINKYIFSDVCIEVLHKGSKNFKLLFTIQFNTFFLNSNYSIKFSRDQIDSINNDIRYPNEFFLDLVFDHSKEEKLSPYDEYSIIWKTLVGDFISRCLKNKNKNEKLETNEKKDKDNSNKEENLNNNKDTDKKEIPKEEENKNKENNNKEEEKKSEKKEEVKKEEKKDEEKEEDKEEDILGSIGNTNNTLNQVNDLLKKIEGEGGSNKEENNEENDDEEDIENYLKNLENK